MHVYPQDGSNQFVKQEAPSSTVEWCVCVFHHLILGLATILQAHPQYGKAEDVKQEARADKPHG